MKTGSLLKTFSKAMLALALLSGLEAKAQSTVTLSRPGTAMYYEHDRTNWNHIYNITNTYNTDGILTTTVRTAPVTSQNIAKEEYILDASNRLNTAKFYNWQSNAWTITTRANYIRTLNAAGKVTENIYQIWKNGALENSRKINNTYDQAGNLMEGINATWTNNAWVNNDKSNFTYNNGVQTERLMSLFNKANSVWVPALKTSFAGWHVPNVHPTVSIEQNLDANGNWVNSARNTMTMGQNGSYELIRENYQNDTWIYNSRDTYTYDSHGNKTDFLMEDFVNGAWRMVWTDKIIYTYNAQNDMLQEVYQGQDSTYGPIRDQYKKVYSNFQYFTRTLGTTENQPVNVGLTLYPNPAQHVLNIELAENVNTLKKATVSDLTGKTILTQTFENGNQKQMNVEKLPAGIYLLQLETAKGKSIQKFVKQ